MKQKIKKGTKLLLAGALAFVVGAYMVLKAPQFHANYLRNKVGSRVATVLKTDQRGGGTGFFVKAASGKTVLLTNAHVCRLADSRKQLLVVTQDGQRFKGKVIEIFKKHDLCVVENKTKIEGLKLSSGVDVGEEIAHLGHPSLFPLTLTRGQLIGYATLPIMEDVMMETGKCAKGAKEVNAFFFIACIRELDSGLTTVPSQGGSSGSPIVGFTGTVVGVLFAGDSMGWSVIVPLKYVKEFLSKF
jgi:S1-C subfamily serine protease